MTARVGVARGTFQALLDADLYLPEGWADDRPRCRDAGIPDAVRYRAEWRIAGDRSLRPDGNGVRFGRPTFDAGHGAAVPFPTAPNLTRRRFAAGGPVDFAARDAAGGRSRRADARLTAADVRGGRRYRVAHRTVRRATAAEVWGAGRERAPAAAVTEATDGGKYFPTNAAAEPLGRVPAVAFRRATVAHAFRPRKREAGTTHHSIRPRHHHRGNPLGWMVSRQGVGELQFGHGIITVETTPLAVKKGAELPQLQFGHGIITVETPLLRR